MCVVSLLVLGGIFALFFILYPNHLYVREQNMMFLLDNEYIRHYFTKPGWFACLAGDFVTQFLYYVGGGATVITILLALLLQQHMLLILLMTHLPLLQIVQRIIL